jgi:hypothetical protein
VSRGERFIMRAFFELSSCRQYGMGPGPIPWNFIQEYADREGLDPDIRTLFADMIRMLDGEYMKDETERWKSERDNKGR